MVSWRCRRRCGVTSRRSTVSLRSASRVDPQRHRPAAVRPTPDPSRAQPSSDRSRGPVRPVRRTDHAAEGDRSSRQRNPEYFHRRAGRAVAGAPDTPEIPAGMTAGSRSGHARRPPRRSSGSRDAVKEKMIALYTDAGNLLCPSVYEPFGIINLEAMACETPVVASAVGGIPEVVEHGETGLLVASRSDRRDGRRAA